MYICTVHIMHTLNEEAKMIVNSLFQGSLSSTVEIRNMIRLMCINSQTVFYNTLHNSLLAYLSTCISNNDINMYMYAVVTLTVGVWCQLLSRCMLQTEGIEHPAIAGNEHSHITISH